MMTNQFQFQPSLYDQFSTGQQQQQQPEMKPFDEIPSNNNYLYSSASDFGYNPNAQQSNVMSMPPMGQQDFMNQQAKTDDQLRRHSLGKPQQNQMPPPANIKKTDTSGAKKDKSKSKQSTEGNQSGFLNSLFFKMGLRGKNQMILPDDKNPSIVWDDSNKKWINTTGDDEDENTPSKPRPPTDSELFGPPGSSIMPPMNQPPPSMSMNQQNQPPPIMNQQNQPPPIMNQQNQQPPMPMNQQSQPNYGPRASTPIGGTNTQPNQAPAPSFQLNHDTSSIFPPNNTNNSAGSLGSNPSFGPPSGNSVNKYQLPRGRGGPLRNNYVDILNPNGSVKSNTMIPSNLGANQPPQNVPQMFIPAPSLGSGDSGPISFLTPGSFLPPEEEINGQAQIASHQQPTFGQ